MTITLPPVPVTARARSRAALKKETPPAADKNCLGFWELLAGQSLVPDPPAIMIQSVNINMSIIDFYIKKQRSHCLKINLAEKGAVSQNQNPAEIRPLGPVPPPDNRPVSYLPFHDLFSTAVPPPG
jgi:hypothetical protein